MTCFTVRFAIAVAGVNLAAVVAAGAFGSFDAAALASANALFAATLSILPEVEE